MNERYVTRDTIIRGRRVLRRSSVVVGGGLMVVFHMQDGPPIEVRPGAIVEGAQAGRRELPAGVVRAPKRTEIIPALLDSQTQRGERRTLATQRVRGRS